MYLTCHQALPFQEEQILNTLRRSQFIASIQYSKLPDKWVKESLLLTFTLSRVWKEYEPICNFI
jgi:hypothetical protein